MSRDPGAKTRLDRKKAGESAFEAGQLPNNPPAELKGMPAARAAWRALMRAHSQLPGDLFNGLDRGFLVGYCMAVQARQRAIELQEILAANYKLRGLPADLQDLLKSRMELRQSIRLVSDLEKQLYATPKSRGGVSPAARELTPDEIIAREVAELNKQINEDEL
ncbi:MAG: hypothetical protein P4L50_25515 [Anaerolineaceae bacterium]|nr:hypothetical protein [Anaerolineaceae bacterium]